MLRYFSQIFLILSLLFLAYVGFKSEITWEGNNRDYYQIYYLLSLFLIIFSITSFYLSNIIKIYLVITISTVLIFLYIIEGFIFHYGKIDFIQLIKKSKMYSKETGKKFDTRSTITIYNELKKNNKDIVFSIQPQLFKKEGIYSLSGISSSETIFCNENGYQAFYKSDRYGFNNPDDQWDNKEIEYFLLGDSFVHGMCVNRPNDFASVLRTISKKRAVNLGFRGLGPLHEYAILREYIRPGVKNILWFYYENSDLMDLESNLKKPILKKYLESENFSQNLVKKQKIVDNLAKKELQRINSNHNKTSQFLKLYKLRTLLSNIFNRRNNVELQPEFIEILEKAKKLSIKNNSKLYFIYLPSYSRYKFNKEDPNYILVKKLVKSLKIPFIDIHEEVFSQLNEPLTLFPFEMNGHYTVYGYRKISEKIYELIEN